VLCISVCVLIDSHVHTECIYALVTLGGFFLFAFVLQVLGLSSEPQAGKVLGRCSAT
jgi:hypothetical protein